MSAKFYVTYYQPQRETEKAVLDALWGWLPKSQIRVYETEFHNVMVLPAWLKMKLSRSNYAFGGCVFTPTDETEMGQWKRIL